MCDVDGIQQALGVARHVGVGAVVGCGAGGVLDAAKALSLLCQSPLSAREALLALERRERELNLKSSRSSSSNASAGKGPKTTLLASAPGAKVRAPEDTSGEVPDRNLPCVLLPSCPSGAESNDLSVVHIGAGALVPVRPVSSGGQDLRKWFLQQDSIVDSPWTDPGKSFVASPSAEPVPVIRPDGSVGLEQQSALASTVSSPAFMADLPPSLASMTGLAVMAHAIESYLNLDAAPRTRAMAMAAIARCSVALVAVDSFIEAEGPIAAWKRERAAGTTYNSSLRLLAEASVLSGASMKYVSAGATRALAMAASCRFELGYSAMAAACLLPVLETSVGMALDGADEFEEDFETLERVRSIEAVVSYLATKASISDLESVDEAWRDAVSRTAQTPTGTIESISSVTRKARRHIPVDRLQLHLLSLSDMETIASGAEATDEMESSCVELTRQDLVECLGSCS